MWLQNKQPWTRSLHPARGLREIAYSICHEKREWDSFHACWIRKTRQVRTCEIGKFLCVNSYIQILCVNDVKHKWKFKSLLYSFRVENIRWGGKQIIYLFEWYERIRKIFLFQLWIKFLSYYEIQVFFCEIHFLLSKSESKFKNDFHLHT